MDYATWNNRLAEYFFRPEYEGRRIFLYVTSELLAELAGSQGGCQEFIGAVRDGPRGTTRQGLCQRAIQVLERGRASATYPQYVAYLGLFVLAAGIEGDFASHAYYPRLRQLLGEEPAMGQYPSFHRMLELWDDLERWANEERAGRLGTFKADIAGNWIHVGLPIAQTILTQHEREYLHAMFAEVGLAPGSAPTDEQIAHVLLTRGQHRLRPRTLRLLENQDRDATLRDVLLQTVLEELQEWDGHYILENDLQMHSSGALRLSCQLDRISNRVTAALRGNVSQEIPDGGLALHCESNIQTFLCEDFGLGWTTELSAQSDSTILDAATLDWTQGVTAHTEDNAWILRLPAAEVRILEPGTIHALPGLVECPRLPRQGTFYLCCRGRVADTIAAWGHTDCESFEEISVSNGLPPSWRMFVGTNARNDERVRDAFPMLAFNKNVRLRCEGGIQHARNHYFTFAAPRILLDGDPSGITVYGNATLLVSTGTEAVFELPPALIRTGKFSLEARRGDEIVARRGIYFSDDPLVGPVDVPWCDSFGRMVGQARSGQAVVCGTVVRGAIPQSEGFFLPDLPPVRRVILVGPKPGQISSLPREQVPTDWQPVWAISLERRGMAFFCGTSLELAEPKTSPVSDRRRLRRWKDILWHRRHRISPPVNRTLAGLWRRYQEAARKV